MDPSTTQILVYGIVSVIVALIYGLTLVRVMASLEQMSENLKSYGAHAIDQNMTLAASSMAHTKAVVNIGGIPLAVKEQELALELKKVETEQAKLRLKAELVDHARRNGVPLTEMGKS